MSSMTFDTHQFVKRLTNAGLKIEIAEVMAEQQRALIEERLATKQDLKEISRDIRELELRLKIWSGTLAVAIIGVLAAIEYFG